MITTIYDDKKYYGDLRSGGNALMHDGQKGMKKGVRRSDSYPLPTSAQGPDYVAGPSNKHRQDEIDRALEEKYGKYERQGLKNAAKEIKAEKKAAAKAEARAKKEAKTEEKTSKKEQEQKDLQSYYDRVNAQKAEKEKAKEAHKAEVEEKRKKADEDLQAYYDKVNAAKAEKEQKKKDKESGDTKTVDKTVEPTTKKGKNSNQPQQSQKKDSKDNKDLKKGIVDTVKNIVKGDDKKQPEKKTDWEGISKLTGNLKTTTDNAQKLVTQAEKFKDTRRDVKLSKEYDKEAKAMAKKISKMSDEEMSEAITQWTEKKATLDKRVSMTNELHHLAERNGTERVNTYLATAGAALVVAGNVALVINGIQKMRGK